MSAACEYCGESDDVPVKSYDAGNGTVAVFHPECHTEMMEHDICGGPDTCDSAHPDGEHCACFAAGGTCCGCKEVPS